MRAEYEVDPQAARVRAGQFLPEEAPTEVLERLASFLGYLRAAVMNFRFVCRPKPVPEELNEPCGPVLVCAVPAPDPSVPAPVTAS